MKPSPFMLVPACLLVLVGCALRTSRPAANPQPDASVAEVELPATGDAIPTPRSAREYEAALERLLPALGAANEIDRAAAQQTLERMCLHAARPGADAEREALCKALARRLAPATPRPARIWLVRQLERVGRDEAVGPLSQLLDDRDEQIREVARRALQHNPAPAAAGALRDALRHEGPGAWRVALINALAARGDELSVPDFARLASEPNSATAQAAISALGAVANENAIDALRILLRRESADVRGASAAALLRGADRLLSAGDYAVAARIHRALLLAVDLPEAVHVAALRGLAETDGSAAVPRLLPRVLDDSRPRLQATAARLLQRIPGADVSAALVSAYEDASPAARALLLDVFAERGDTGGRALALAGLSDSSQSVRLAALDALRVLGKPVDGIVIAECAADDDEETVEAARAALTRLGGVGAAEPVNAALRDAVARSNSPKARAEVIAALTRRRDPQAAELASRYVDDPSPVVRIAALEALADIGEPEVALQTAGMRCLRETDDEVRAVAEDTLVRAVRKTGREKAWVLRLFATASQEQGEQRATLIRVIGRLGGSAALSVLVASLEDPYPSVVEAAVRGLADWNGADALDPLARVARESNDETHRVLALRGYARIVRQSDLGHVERISRLETGLTLAWRPDEKRLLLAALGDVPNVFALAPARRYLHDDALRAEAAVAMARIARRIAPERIALAASVLDELSQLRLAPSAAQAVTDAADLLERFGDYAGLWQLAGPYREQGKKSKDLFDIEFEPEHATAERVTWRRLRARRADNPWIFDLTRVDDGVSTCLYARTRIWSDQQRPAHLLLGSDDGVKAWLNGKLVHANLAYRGVTPDEDQVEVTLSQGWNTLLLKVVQGDGGWGFCCAVRDRDNQPIPSLKYSLADEADQRR